jgi:hypothetical protein
MKKKKLILIFICFVSINIFSCRNNEPSVPPDSLQLSIRNILEIPVYEQIYRDIVYIGEEERILFFKTTDKKLLFSIDIRIQAGIRDAERISLEMTGEAENGLKTAVVDIPRSEILLVDADEKTIEQYFLKEWGGEISRLEYYDEIKRKKEELIQTAVDSGILEKADTNAEKLIKSFLALSNIEVTEFRMVENEN